jgi:hypothetical protein
MTTQTSETPAQQTTPAHGGGPKTAEGKAISARNATTHGLFCRQTVLPHLGEDPAAYQSLLDHLNEQVRPRNLMEKQYIELWADASWKLRRLSRLEAQIWENDTLDEDARLTKLERLGRLQNSTRRQMDKSIRMLGRDLHDMFAHRTREDVLSKMELTETQVQELVYRRKEVEKTVQANTYWPDVDDRLTGTLDAIPDTKICENELPAPCTATPPTSTPNPPVSGGPCERSEQGGGQSSGPAEFQQAGEEAAQKICQNELPESELLQNNLPARPRISRTLPPIPINFEREGLQLREDMLNNPKIPIEDRCDIARDLGSRLSFEEGGPGIRVMY